MFCVECGDEVPDGELRDALCPRCFLSSTAWSSLPALVDVEVCVHCGARRRGGTAWVDEERPMEEVVEAAVREAMGVERRVEEPRVHMVIEPEDVRNHRAAVTVEGTVEGLEFHDEHETRVRLKNATCTRCSRFHGGYFESTVQLRRDGPDGLGTDELQEASRLVEAIVDRVRRVQGDRDAYVLRMEPHHGGLDVQLGTTAAGRAVARGLAEELGGRLGESPQLAGRKEGEDVYRMAYSVRVPPFRVGDVVVHDDAVLLVRSIGSKHVRAVLLPSLDAITVERDRLEHATVLKAADAEEAVVVSRRGREVQVLDPQTFRTVTVQAPPRLSRALETVPVHRYRDRLILRPPSLDESGDASD